MDMHVAMHFLIYSSTDEKGRRILQQPGNDYLQVNGFGLLAQCMLLGLFVLAALYSLFALLFDLVSLLKQKLKLRLIFILHCAVNISVIITVMIFTYLTVQLSSGLALKEHILWSVVLNGFIALIPIAYTFKLCFSWRKMNLTGRQKARLILSGAAGLIMTANVIFWQSYKFW
jgi:hypothetical protein